jgi:hypothetical protein
MTESVEHLAHSLTSAILRTVFDVWARTANGRIGPQRAELSPAKLRKTTTHTFAVELVDGGQDFRFGFTGEKVMQFLDRRCDAPTLAGMRGTRFFDDAEKLIRQCVVDGRPVISSPRRTHYSGREYLEREVLLLPLSEDGVRVTGLIGALDTWLLGTHSPAEPVC